MNIFICAVYDVKGHFMFYTMTVTSVESIMYDFVSYILCLGEISYYILFPN